MTLPANVSDKADVVLRLPAEPAPNAKVALTPLQDGQGVPITPQPTIAMDPPAGDKLTLHFTDIHFWGEAKLTVNVDAAKYTYTLQRGLELARPAGENGAEPPPGKGSEPPKTAPRPNSGPVRIAARTGSRAELWLFNPGRSALSPRWRVVSGGESVCGVESNGEPRRDCAAEERWAQAKFGPGRSDRLLVPVPHWWFHPWRLFGDKTRNASLEMRFGDSDTAPLQRIDFQLYLETDVADMFAAWSPVKNILWVTFWVTLGAVLLMLAQVMIPNFRQCLRMETQLDMLQERLRAIGSRVGDRLYTRCDQEIKSLRLALAMEEETRHQDPQQRAGWRRLLGWNKGWRQFVSWPRVALSGNTLEVNRLAGVLPRIESRMRLTERLDEIQSAKVDMDAGALPSTLCLNRERQIRAIQAILSRQFITETEEKIASTMLDEIEDVQGSLKEFASELELRIAALRRQFAIEPWKSEHPNLTDALAGCADLLKDPPDAPPEGGWTTDELIERDLCAIKLAIVHRMITLAARLTADSAVDAFVASRLESDNAAQLAEAQTALSMLSDGVSDQAIQSAFTGGKWDALYEPATVTDQDVVRASFQFRDRTLNACASKSGFRCWWHIHVDGDGGQDPVDLDEPGWEVQFIPQRGRMTVQPAILDRTGNVLSYSSPAGQPVKGLFDTRVRQPGANTALSRALRGLLDAALTALVPVVTVAVTQAQNKVSVGQLILIGFTSQAIRAAVVPESVTTPRDARSAPPTSP